MPNNILLFPVSGAGIGPASGMLVPARTLFVSTAWPAGADPLVFFTTISAALIQAATLVPTAASPIAIIVYPGTYPAALTLVSNAHIVGAYRRDVEITGPISWTPGAGVNAPQTAANELCGLYNLDITNLLAIDATGKAASLSTCEVRDCGLSTTTHIGRAGLMTDRLQIFDTIDFGIGGGGGGITMTNTNGNLYHSFFLGITLLGTTGCSIQGHQVFGTLTVNAGTTCNMDQTDTFAPVVVAAGGILSAVGSVLASTVSSAAGALVDIRGSEYFSAAALIGPGPIDRSITIMTGIPTAPGPNVVAIVPPFPDATYNVHATDVSVVPGGVTLSVPAATKLPGSFTMVEGLVGRAYDVTLLKV